MDIAASTGIHDGKAAIKQILAGAKAVQMCSVLYQKGVEKIPVIKKELETWMEHHHFKSIEEFRGKMNLRRIPDPSIYERTQFMKHYSSYQ
jgi:dihydroorotate dehydrogenase (fumarate)